MTTITGAALRPPGEQGLLGDYAEHCLSLGLSTDARAARLDAAQQFLARHRDLSVWMHRPVQTRLVDLQRAPLAWPLVGFAFLTGRVSADFELLACKHAGRSFAAAVEAIYPDDLDRLRAAASRLEWAPPHGPPLCWATACRWSWPRPDTSRAP